MITGTITATYAIATYTLSSGAVFALEYRATAGEVGVMTTITLAIIAVFVLRWTARW